MSESRDVGLPHAWKELLQGEFEKPYFSNLRNVVRSAYLHDTVYPPPQVLFRALELVSPKETRVVILGQDPYHTPGVADGLAFSSVKGNRVPPSLQNIYKEISREFGCALSVDPDLTRWAKQGVLLLNASLTVLSGRANSHAAIGWHEFTDAIIAALSREEEYTVFLLWGNYARQKKHLIDSKKHHVLESPHPSPLSAHAGFFGNGHFIEANDFLREHGRGEIEWCDCAEGTKAHQGAR